jgi:N-glycosylase/DNA lyase
MGFRAPYLKSAAEAVASGAIDLEAIGRMELEAARNELVKLSGVGPKIANCVLLFAYGFPTAFPLDVWILRALKDLYFPGESASLKGLTRFSETYFGPYSGYAQQYLFHAVRTGIIPLPKLDRNGPKKVNQSRRPS